MFVDRATIEVHAGNGGDGCLSFRRERYIPRGGPDGGDGGNGGSVIIVADSGSNHLSSLSQRRFWKAKRGANGQGSNRHGKSGADLTIRVPPGTIVRDADEGFIIRDLVEEGETLTAARGGRGGKGNAHFKSSTNQAPRQITEGEEGEVRKLELELKVIADVGLVGMPNAGKSTLLSRLTKARPEIANYPFTTKFPNLGMVQVDMRSSFVMADIPGLIEGASEGTGLGHEFLRHIERSGVLVHLVEPDPITGGDPIENHQAIRRELTEYREELGQRPEITVVTKSELPGAQEVRDKLAEVTGREVLLISAVTGAGLNHLTGAIQKALQERNAKYPGKG